MKRLLYLIALLLITAAFFCMGSRVCGWIDVWFLAEAAILAAVLAAALLLPGSPTLWVELLGTAATLPPLWRLLPFEMAMPSFPLVPNFLLYGIYLVLSLLLATVAPMFLLLAFGWLLE